MTLVSKISNIFNKRVISPSLYQTASRSFQTLEQHKDQDKLPMFVVGRSNGFLPRKHPLKSLPSKYSIIEKLLADMVMEQKDGSKGLLWKGEFGERLKRDLPLIDLSDVQD